MTTNDDVLARLAKIDCCALSDALDQLKMGGVVTGLTQGSGGGRVAGRAITVRLVAGVQTEGAPKHLCATAIELGGPGAIIVVEQRTGIEAGSWGGLLSMGAQTKGIEAVIAEGPVRDIDQAMEMKFPVFARSWTARTARGRIREQATNVPVQVGDVTVSPGDYVLADRSAVIFVAESEIEKVLVAAERIVAKEELMAKEILQGVEIGTVMGANYEHMLK
ncbi:MAG: RraA family protein [Beijerinckiaceae bacterium]|jgi:4-hydroxy-4-methyl-2-oxoglutarate aldolase